MSNEWKEREEILALDIASKSAELAHVRAIGKIKKEIMYAPPPAWWVWWKKMHKRGWEWEGWENGESNWAMFAPLFNPIALLSVRDAALMYAAGEYPPEPKEMMSGEKAVYTASDPRPLTFSEWMQIMRVRGYFHKEDGSFYKSGSSVTLTEDEAMEFFRAGETPPPPSWDDVAQQALDKHHELCKKLEADNARLKADLDYEQAIRVAEIEVTDERHAINSRQPVESKKPQ